MARIPKKIPKLPNTCLSGTSRCSCFPSLASLVTTERCCRTRCALWSGGTVTPSNIPYNRWPKTLNNPAHYFQTLEPLQEHLLDTGSSETSFVFFFFLFFFQTIREISCHKLNFSCEAYNTQKSQGHSWVSISLRCLYWKYIYLYFFSTSDHSLAWGCFRSTIISSVNLWESCFLIKRNLYTLQKYYSFNTALETCLEMQAGGFELWIGNHSSLWEFGTELGGFSVFFLYEYSCKMQVNIY